MHPNIFEVRAYLYFITLFNIHIPEVKQRKQNIGTFINIVFSFPIFNFGHIPKPSSQLHGSLQSPNVVTLILKWMFQIHPSFCIKITWENHSNIKVQFFSESEQCPQASAGNSSL